MKHHQVAVIRRLPHPGRGFTQGLSTDGTNVWESTGLYGHSTLRRYRLGATEPDWISPLDPAYFGEGICRIGTHLWQLTWREHRALRWSVSNHTLADTVPLDRDGWGICHTGSHVITSDGSSELIARDPHTLRPLRTLPVTYAGDPLPCLNDLEWAGDRIWANLYGTAYLVGINPHDGTTTDLIDARTLHTHEPANPETWMNGIAAHPTGGFLLTGKHWTRIYHIRLTPDHNRIHPRHYTDMSTLCLGSQLETHASTTSTEIGTL